MVCVDDQLIAIGNEDTTAEVATKIFLLLKEITKDITANSPRTCYPYDTAEQFFSTLGNLFASSENRAELVSEVADGWKDTVDEVTACQALNQICGQSQATFTGTSLVHGYGVQDSGDAQTFCTKFEVRDFGSAAGLQGCMRYECISYTELATISTSEILDDLNLAMSEIAEFNFLNSALDKVSLVNGNVKMSIDLEQHVIDDQQLSGYNAANPVDGQSILRPARLVLHANGSVGYDTSGIQVVSGETNENTVTFEADQTGQFVVLVQKNVGQVVDGTATTTTAGSNPTDDGVTLPGEISGGSGGSAGIIGGAVCAIVVVGALGAAFVVMRRRRQAAAASEAAAKVNPSSAEDAVANGDAVMIDMDAVGGMDASDIRTRDPEAMPNYLAPPTYEEFMVAKEEGLEHTFGPQEDEEPAEEEPEFAEEEQPNEADGEFDESADRGVSEDDVVDGNEYGAGHAVDIVDGNQYDGAHAEEFDEQVDEAEEADENEEAVDEPSQDAENEEEEEEAAVVEDVEEDAVEEEAVEEEAVDDEAAEEEVAEDEAADEEAADDEAAEEEADDDEAGVVEEQPGYEENLVAFAQADAVENAEDPTEEIEEEN